MYAETVVEDHLSGCTGDIDIKYLYDGAYEQQPERNFIDNDADIISNARQVEGIVSHETQLGMLPGSIVDDAQEELLRIRQEAADEEQIPMAVV